ncbi:MAG: beta-lactamase family protein, partial [Alphaproteobacteria bacterium]|nr:beta-lactamase family protein [Alphaproteobacteria bacterium]
AGLAMARIENGQLSWTHYTGEQGPGIPASADTLFNTGSITKTITAELTLRLADAGHISLDEPIASEYIHPDLAEDPRYNDLTPRIILSHQSGLLNWAYQYENFELAFVQDPGSGFTYSGEAFEMLVAFLAARMDSDFASLVDTYVFDPMGLENMHLGATAAEGPNRATPMDADGVYGEPDRFAFPPNSADNLFTTLEDYTDFLMAIMADEARRDDLSTARRAIISNTDEQAPCFIEPAENCPTTTGYSLGWAVYAYEDTTVIHHGGSDWGENAFAYFDTAGQDGYVIFGNGGNSMGAIFTLLEWLDPQDRAASYFLALPPVQASLAQMRGETAP